jgi:hypothetical protein
VAYPQKESKLETIALKPEKMLLICAPGHAFTKSKGLKFSHLEGQKFIGFEPDIPTRKAIDLELKEHGITIKHVMEFDNIETVKRAVEIGAGVSIVPAGTVAQEVSKNTLVAMRALNHDTTSFFVSYNFRLTSRPDATQDLKSGLAPTGQEQVHISVRQRGAPLDLMVAEAMILANSTWGNWMNELGVPGIYRSQASLLPGVKVRMGTKALPHAGIGVPSYAWSTSPLRRYTDLVNQWQIIACAKHGNTAALAAPFKPKDAELFSIISAFDGAYSAYNGYQAGMERFWTLQYLKQHHITELTATVFKTFPGQPPMARADTLPLVLPVLGNSELPRGARVQLRLGAIDDITLDVSGQFMALLDTADATGTDGTQAPEDDDDSAAGPIAIAVDMDDAPAAEVSPT